MNFAWAMDMVLNQERAVRREGWRLGDYILKQDERIVFQYGRFPYIEPWYPSQTDMLAEDWVEVLEV